MDGLRPGSPAGLRHVSHPVGIDGKARVAMGLAAVHVGVGGSVDDRLGTELPHDPGAVRPRRDVEFPHIDARHLMAPAQDVHEIASQHALVAHHQNFHSYFTSTRQSPFDGAA